MKDNERQYLKLTGTILSLIGLFHPEHPVIHYIQQTLIDGMSEDAREFKATEEDLDAITDEIHNELKGVRLGNA